MPMQAVKAIVRNGRLVVDEATDLPEGEVVELVPLDEVLASGGDYLDDEERTALHQELEASVAEADAGKLIDADLFQDELETAKQNLATLPPSPGLVYEPVRGKVIRRLLLPKTEQHIYF